MPCFFSRSYDNLPDNNENFVPVAKNHWGVSCWMPKPYGSVWRLSLKDAHAGGTPLVAPDRVTDEQLQFLREHPFGVMLTAAADLGAVAGVPSEAETREFAKLARRAASAAATQFTMAPWQEGSIVIPMCFASDFAPRSARHPADESAVAATRQMVSRMQACLRSGDHGMWASSGSSGNGAGSAEGGAAGSGFFLAALLGGGLTTLGLAHAKCTVRLRVLPDATSQVLIDLHVAGQRVVRRLAGLDRRRRRPPAEPPAGQAPDVLHAADRDRAVHSDSGGHRVRPVVGGCARCAARLSFAAGEFTAQPAQPAQPAPAAPDHGRERAPRGGRQLVFTCTRASRW